MRPYDAVTREITCLFVGSFLCNSWSERIYGVLLLCINYPFVFLLHIFFLTDKTLYHRLKVTYILYIRSSVEEYGNFLLIVSMT